MIEIGKCYFVRDGVDYWLGRAVEIHPHHVTLEDASWISVTGRLSEFMTNGKAESMEVEPVGVVTANLHTWLPWNHPLFTKAV